MIKVQLQGEDGTNIGEPFDLSITGLNNYGILRTIGPDRYFVYQRLEMGIVIFREVEALRISLPDTPVKEYEIGYHWWSHDTLDSKDVWEYSAEGWSSTHPHERGTWSTDSMISRGWKYLSFITPPEDIHD